MTRHGLSFLSFANLLLGCSVLVACTPYSRPSSQLSGDTDADADAMAGTDADDPDDPAADGRDDDHGDGDDVDADGDETGTSGSDLDDDTGDDDGDDDGATGGVAGSCDAVTHRCVAPAPEGWFGPVIRRELDADGDAGCPSKFTSAIEGLHRDLVDTEHACGCECGNALNVECQGSATVAYRAFTPSPFPGYAPTPAGCTGGSVTTVSSVAASLGSYGSGAHSFQSTLLNTEVVGGYCNEIEEASFADPHFTTRAIACEPNEPVAGVCEGEDLCVPKQGVPFDLGMCIFAEGDVECPAEGPYVERTVYHAGFDDTRECSECNCGAPSGTCDDPTVLIGQFNIFSINPSITIPATSGCVPWATSSTTNITAMYMDAGTPDASCSPLPGGGVELGSVTPQGATTMCCAAG